MKRRHQSLRLNITVHLAIGGVGTQAPMPGQPALVAAQFDVGAGWVEGLIALDAPHFDASSGGPQSPGSIFGYGFCRVNRNENALWTTRFQYCEVNRCRAVPDVRSSHFITCDHISDRPACSPGFSMIQERLLRWAETTSSNSS